MNSYQQIFQQRGLQFAQACQQYAAAIQDELNHFIRFADLHPSDVVLDAAAAGGFLSQHLQQHHDQVIALDPCFDLSRLAAETGLNSVCASLTTLPFQAHSFDKILCLVSLHHETQLQQFLHSAQRILKPGGFLVIAEVEQDSAPATFLNQFVDQHSRLGHQGDFFSAHYLGQIQQAGFLVHQSTYQSYHWQFQSRRQLTEAIQMMFGIDQANLSQISQAIEDILGTDALQNGSIGMRWGLRYVNCMKKV